MLALDQFVLWVNADAPYKTAKEYLDAIRNAPDNKFSMGGTGSKQEDQLITVALGKKLGKKLTYVPFKGGGDVATQLVGGHINSTVNNPVEAVAHWRAGKLRALCVFRTERMPQSKKVTADQGWSDIPTCKESGVDVSYQMLRGVFLPAAASAEQVSFYVDLFQRVRTLPEWKDFVETGAFQDTFMSGPSYADWLQNTDNQHRGLMQEAGFLAP
jgi:putative tricarboxylic transport membrane protein